MTPVQNVILDNDEGNWMFCLEDDLGSHWFTVDPQLVHDALAPWRAHMAEGEAVRQEYEAAKRQHGEPVSYREYHCVDPEESWIEEMRSQADFLRKRYREEAAWHGVYPGMCIDPEVCRGYTHCPRPYSCCE